MKKINILLLFIFSLNSYSQIFAPEQIIDIEENNGHEINGAYYKDINNLLDPFIGTYVFNNGNKYFKLILEKRIKSNFNGYCFADYMIGEYQYIESSVEVNTLNKLQMDFSDARFHSIGGNDLLTGQINGCYDCTPDEKRLRMGIFDDVAKAGGTIIIRRVTVGNQQAINLILWWHARGQREGEPELLQPILNGGEFIMIKQ